MSLMQQRLAGARLDPIVPVCPICEKPMARRPVSFVNGRPWCRACFVLLMKIRRMEIFLGVPGAKM